MPSSNFKEFKISKDPISEQETKVVKIDSDVQVEVQTYSPNALVRAGEREYSFTKAKYGPLAATDPDRPARSSKDSRFLLNPLLRNPLAIEDEEKKEIDRRVRTEIDRVKKEAHAEAYQEGYEAGKKEGRNEALESLKVETARWADQFRSLVQELEQAKSEIFRANERFLIDLIYRIGRMLILKELAQDRSYLKRLCEDLIERVGVRENIRISVSPEDLETAKLIEPELLKDLGELKNLQIEASSRVKGGGILLETQWNTIDASIETQLNGLYQALVDPNAKLEGGSGI